ncbi:hypothetical protein D9M71_256080 [compost metagenome]
MLPDTLPAVSAWLTPSTWPLSCAAFRLTVNTPPPFTTAVPSTLLPASRTVTVAPASPVPVSTRPLTDRLVTTGLVGGVMSAACRKVGCDSPPISATAVTEMCSPLSWAASSVRVKEPFRLATPVPIRLPAASYTRMPTPLGALPVRVRPSLPKVTSVGGTGGAIKGVR